MQFDSLRLDHVGIRVTDLDRAEAFDGKFGFTRDPEEYAPSAKAFRSARADRHAPLAAQRVLHP